MRNEVEGKSWYYLPTKEVLLTNYEYSRRCKAMPPDQNSCNTGNTLSDLLWLQVEAYSYKTPLQSCASAPQDITRYGAAKALD